MLALINKGIEPSAPSSDPITYLTSVNYLQSITNDTTLTTVEKIKDLLSTSKTRLHGLLLLKIALEQNSDIYVKGKWPVVLNEILNDSVAPILKEHACEIFCMLLPYMSKENEVYSLELKNFFKEMFPFLLTQIDENVEWSKAALKCVHTCLKYSPRSLVPHKDHLLTVILKKISYSVSSEIFEIIADCFCELPNVVDRPASTSYAEEWKKQYLTILNTQQQLLDTYITFLSSDPFTNAVLKIEAGTYIFDDDNDENSKDVLRAYMKGARRYINLSKVLAKMLSSKTKCAVEVPLKLTLITTTRLFQVQDFRNIKPTSTELQIFCSVLSQMQMASLLVLESILSNFTVLPYSSVIAELMQSALAASKLTNISIETISQIRLAVWKILKLFVKKYGSKVSGDVLKLHDSIIRELLSDISIEEKSQVVQNQNSPRSKKNAPNSGKRKHVNEELQQICKEALETLEQLVYTGSLHFTKNEFQEIFSKVLQVASTIRVSHGTYPIPYDDELCRKNLYSVLLALTVISNLDQSELAQCAIGLLKNGFQDSSSEVTGFCNIAMAVLNSKIHPKRPPPKYRIPAGKQRTAKISSAIVKCSEWSSDDFVPDLPLEPKARENVTPRIAQTFHDPNDSAVLQEEPIEEDMEAEPHYSEHYTECFVLKYPEQGSESHHNGEEVLEIQHSNQDDVESEEEDEEEEDDERSYGDEEMNQDDIPPENLYIPSTSKLQVVTPVQISPETVPQNVDREYEQLRPCVKTEGSVDSNKNTHLNGEHNIVPADADDGDVPSSSTQQTLANENGVYMYEEEDLEEEECDEDEEEENVSFPAEKRIPPFYSSNPPTKRQKLDTNDEVKSEPQEDESPRSPTLTEMKADFCCNEIEDVKS